jgi:hypothetical protein
MSERPWRVRMLDFLGYMRTRGHRYTWLIFGQVVRPIGPSVYKKRPMNDNYLRQPKR